MQLQGKHGIQHKVQKIKREKIQALSLAKDCYSMKLEALTNATVIDDAISFVSQKSKEKLKSSGGEDDKEQVVVISLFVNTVAPNDSILLHVTWINIV